MEDNIKKSNIRTRMIIRRDTLENEMREKMSQQIADKLFSAEKYKSATTVLSYASFRSEVVTDEINRKVLTDGKRLYLPKTYVDKHEMVFYSVCDYDAGLVSGTMGIREPKAADASDERVFYSQDCISGNVMSNQEVMVTDKILVIMPGVAYDKKHNRLGYGGGYYDRFLSKNSFLIENTILLAYSVQEVPSIESESTDIKPKLILTECGLV